MKIRYTIFFLSLLLSQFAMAQPALAWSQRYNGLPDYSDEARDIVVDNSGNSYVTGSAFGANGTLDIVTIKYSSSGQQLWLQSYNGTANDNDEGYDIQLGDSNNVYVCGYSKNTGTMQDLTVIKYNSSGVLQWARTYNGSFNNYDVGNALALDANGNVYVTGIETNSTYTYDFATLKYSTGGTQMWVQTYNGPGNFNDEARDIVLDAAGNVYVAGTQDTFFASQPNADMVLIKYDNSGAQQWRRVYDSPSHGYEYAKNLVIDGTGQLIMSGYAFVTGNGNDIFLLKYNSSGAFQWIQSYNYSGTSFEQPNAMTIDSQNNIIVAAQGIGSSGNNDYVTVKYNSGGTFQWASRYSFSSTSEDRAYGICMGDSSTIFVTGFCTPSANNKDIATVKYDANGNQLYVLQFSHTANKDDIGNAVAFKAGDIYVTGLSTPPNGNSDYITLRYSYSAIGISENAAPIANLDCYPNPTSDQVRIPVNANGNGEYNLEVTNAIGQTVISTIATATESTGNKDVLILNTTTLPAGVYTIRVADQNNTIGIARVVIQ
jgi:uncharacterized delta-60 repeat protein